MQKFSNDRCVVLRYSLALLIVAVAVTMRQVSMLNSKTPLLACQLRGLETMLSSAK
jgi:hypothetical protein